MLIFAVTAKLPHGCLDRSNQGKTARQGGSGLTQPAGRAESSGTNAPSFPLSYALARLVMVFDIGGEQQVGHRQRGRRGQGHTENAWPGHELHLAAAGIEGVARPGREQLPAPRSSRGQDARIRRSRGRRVAWKGVGSRSRRCRAAGTEAASRSHRRQVLRNPGHLENRCCSFSPPLRATAAPTPWPPPLPQERRIDRLFRRSGSSWWGIFPVRVGMEGLDERGVVSRSACARGSGQGVSTPGCICTLYLKCILNIF
jgi:hypothetical protein